MNLIWIRHKSTWICLESKNQKLKSILPAKKEGEGEENGLQFLFLIICLFNVASILITAIIFEVSRVKKNFKWQQKTLSIRMHLNICNCHILYKCYTNIIVKSHNFFQTFVNLYIYIWANDNLIKWERDTNRKETTYTTHTTRIGEKRHMWYR